ncbi:zinc finger protein 729 [Teleopsis dalmanni]|uniref:zinc finger protein 729-like n=1 Tax=Teleopsis dalmanni TaxID=139649 RepID=UPI0018CF2F9E|nr:zinc finger protein 729-like [Teleopsis dalmanni]XP_037935620.1 zinc finger protein 729 [Teleopsis dalmanni]
MICCLCLNELEYETAVALPEEDNSTKSLIKLILNYNRLKVSDSYFEATSYICLECNERLFEFHQFCLYVKKKQNAIKINRLEIILPLVNENDEYIENISNNGEDVYNDESNGCVDEQAQCENVEETNKVQSEDRKNCLKCNMCNKAFQSKIWLQHHKKRVHEQKINRLCKICNQSFYKPETLRRHIQNVHNNTYLYVCDICGKKFKSKTSHTKHILAHQGIAEPPEQCETCGKWLKNKHCLTVHRISHTAPHIEQCHLCERVCSNKISLRQHIKYVHKLDKKHKCHICRKSFKLQKELEEHSVTHTGAQPYSCSYCPKKFSAKPNMYVHIKRVHIEEWRALQRARSNDPNINLSAQN